MAATASTCRAVTALALGGAVLAGCTGGSNGVAVSAPHPSGAAATGCAALIAHLPDDLALGGSRLKTNPSSPYTAAFGSPPVLVRCGAAIPRYAPTADVLTVDGVEWLVVPDSKSSQRFVSFHEELPVEVTVTLPQLPANVLPAVSALLNEQRTG